MFLKIVLENIFQNPMNTILVFFENCYYSLNLMFCVFFSEQKKVESNIFSIFFIFSLFLKTKKKKQFSKNCNQVFVFFPSFLVCSPALTPLNGRCVKECQKTRKSPSQEKAYLEFLVFFVNLNAETNCRKKKYQY